MSNIVSILQKRAMKYRDKMAYILLEDGKHETERMTYDALDKQARSIAALLQIKNLYGQRVLLLYPTGLDFITAFMGCLYAGAIAVPIAAPRLGEFNKSSAIIKTIAKDADIAGILTINSYLPDIEEDFWDQIQSNKIFVTDTDNLKNNSDSYEPFKIKDDTIAYLQYTSGSVSAPKGVVIQHGSLTTNLKNMAKVWHYIDKSVTLTWSPHSHVYGLLCGLLVPLYHGTPSIIMPTDAFVREPMNWLKAISKYQVTNSGGPNFAYDLCVDSIPKEEIQGLDLKSWKIAVNGGEKVQFETLLRFAEKFKETGFQLNYFNSAYGMSEVTGAIAVTGYLKEPTVFNLATEALKNNEVVITDKYSPHRVYISNGHLLPKLEVEIVDPDTLKPLPKGKIGEIWIAGKAVANGYWGRLEETDETFHAQLRGSHKTYFRTGDLGFIYKHELCLTGRLKEILVVRGKKYNPQDLEITVKNFLKELGINNPCAAFSVSINENDEIIFLQEIPEETSAELQQKMMEKIQYCVMQNFGIDLYNVFLVKQNSLPKTTSGKLQHKLCQKLFLEDKLAIINKHSVKPKESSVVEKKEETKDFNIENILKIIAAVLKIDVKQIDVNASLSEYHFDSIKIIQISNVLNEAYHLGLTPAELYEYSTLKEFLNKLLEKNSEKKNKISQQKIQPVKETYKTNDIAIIGMSGIFPESSDIDALWENLILGKDCIREIPKDRWDWKKYYGDPQFEENKTKIKWGGFINEIAQFDTNFFSISPREAELTDPQQRLFLHVVWQAIEDAGYSTAELSKLKTGLFVGVFNNDYAELLQKQNLTDAYITTGTAHSILANRVSFILNFHGPSEAIDTACSSSLVAIHNAVLAIQNGDCEIAIAGGANALLSPSSYMTANKAGMLSEDGKCKTFDKNANGYVRGEGVAAIILKPLQRALADGDHIYGVIKGISVNHGGHVSSLTVPNPNAQADVIVDAIKHAQVEVESINFIETHGTGTSLGDPIEINGLKKAFNTINEVQGKILPDHSCGLGAVKSNIGHLEATAGIVGVIKVLLAMKHKKIPGNLHLQELNPYIELNDSPFYVVKQTQAWERVINPLGGEFPRRAGISSFGFGGTNAHVIIEEGPDTHFHPASISELPYLITLSAKTEAALQQKIIDLRNWLNKQEEPVSLSAMAFTLNVGRNHFEKRCVFVIKSIDELKDTLNQIQLGNKPDNYIINTNANDKTKIRPLFDELFQMLVKEMKSAGSIQEYRSKLLALGKFYAEGLDVDWEQLHQGVKQRISLPTYPFAKEYYWIPTKASTVKTEKVITKMIVNNSDLLKRIQEDFIQHVSSILKIPREKIDLLSALSELGFDSISFKELAAHLEKFYSIELTPALFFTHNNIQTLSEYLLENNSARMHEFYQQTESLVISEPQIEVSQEITKNIPQDSSEPIAIIGMQGYLPKSKDLNEFWDHLVAGDDLVGEIPIERWDWRDYFGDAKNDPTKTNSKWGGCLKEIDKFDAKFFNISTREANLMDPQHRLFLEIVWKTIEDAGYDPFSFSAKDVGLFAGVEFSEYQNLVYKHNIYHGHVSTGTSHALLANRISYFLNLQGPSEVIDTACSSSLVAINRAIHALRNGECSVAIAGGVSLMLSPETFIVTSQLGALSPDGRCKTFDKSANGYVKGEGVAAVLLKPLSQAQKDNDTIYGVIKSSVVNHGGKAQSLTAPNASTQKELLMKAYTQAEIPVDSVSYIETHGTGTELGDPIEIEGLKEAFNALLKDKNKKNYCGIGSVKSNIGHLEPASGIVGLIKVLLAMQHGKIPGNLHFKELNPYIDISNSPFFIVNKNAEWKRLQDSAGMDVPRRAGISSFGFGGTCAHIVVEEPLLYQRQINTQHKPYYLITLSAKEHESLKQKISDLHLWLKHNYSKTNLEALSFTLNAGRTHFDVRCAIVVNSLDELLNSLQAMESGQQPGNCIVTVNQAAIQNSPLFNEIYHSVMAALKNFDTLTPKVYREKLLVLADLYTRYFRVDWLTLHAGERHHRIASLPTYPFIRQRYWFDAEIKEIIKPIENKPKEIKSKENKTTVKIQPAIIQSKGSQFDIDGFTLKYLQQIFAEKLRISPDEIDINSTYEVFGVDSLIGLEITNRLEKDFGTLPKTLLYERSKLSDLAKYFIQKYKEKLQSLGGQQENSNEIIVDALPKVDSSDQERSLVANPREDIAIIGINGIYPLAKNLDEFWDNLTTGRDCITEVPTDRWNYKDYPVQVGGEEKYFKYGGFISDVDKFDPLFFGIAPRDASLMDPQERLFLQSVWATIEDAGYTRERLQTTTDNKVGVFAGVTYNFYPLFIADEWTKGNRLPLDIQLFSIANRVSYFLNVNGPSYIVDTACSSSLAAIHLACESIHNGECVMAIAGGVNLTLHPSKYHFLGSYSFMSDQGRCASFAEGGAGYVPSEGVGAVLLKPLSLAIRDNDRIYAVIKGSSMNHGGKTSGYTVPNPNAQAELINSALHNANVDARTISYVEAHGTGTALGDPIEIRGLQEAFEKFTLDKQFCAIGSVKSNIGHCESAAGISQVAKVILQMEHKKLVPSIHAEKLNPFIEFDQSPFYVQRELSDWNVPNNTLRRAGVSSFGAGGANVHLILEEYIAPASNINAEKPFVFLASAMNAERLQEYIKNIISYLQKEQSNYKTQDEMAIWLSKVCYTLQVGRESMSAKLAIIANDFNDLMQKLKSYLTNKLLNQVWTNEDQKNKTEKTDINELIQHNLHEKLVEQWLVGVNIHWDKLYRDNKPNIISLPTYPFAKRRCWVPSEVPSKPMPIQKQNSTDLNDWLYQTIWEPVPLENVKQNSNPDEFWLIFSDKELGFMLQDEIGKSNCIYCFAGDEFAKYNDNTFYIHPDRANDYHKLLQSVHKKLNSKLKGIIYLWPIMHDQQNMQTNERLLYLFQNLIPYKWENKLKFCLITRGSQFVAENDPISIWQRPLWSMTRIFAAEQGNYQPLLVDLDNIKNLRAESKNIVKEIKAFSIEENHIAYRGKDRFGIRLNHYMAKENLASWQVPESVIITGGLGALGTEVAKWLIQQGTKHLLLIGTSALPPKSEWKDSKNEKVIALNELLRLNVDVRYEMADVTNKSQMHNAIEKTEKSWNKKINGVFHLAGVTTDSLLIDKMTQEQMNKVLSVKIQGALVLHEIFNKPDLDCFVLFSSIASLPFFGMSGLSAYAVANEFLNGFSAFRRQKGLPSISIDWSAWSEKGMSHRYNHSKFLDAVGMSTIPLVKGVELLEKIMQLQLDNIIVFKIDWQKFFITNAIAKKLKFFNHFVSNVKTPVENIKTMSKEEVKNQVLNTLSKILDLDISEIDPELPFQNFGLDSIIGVNFVAALGEYFPDIVSPMDLYRYPIVNQLVDFIFQSSSSPSISEQDNNQNDTQREDDELKKYDKYTDDQINKLIEDEISDLDL